jgi:cytoskeletal protein CcmA (bactofilin family)
MFKKDKSLPESAAEKAPTSFNNPQSSLIPKQANKDGKPLKASSTTLIARDTELFGDIKFSGTLEIEGVIVGNITANPGSEAAVRILENGRVEGDLQVPRVMINGLIKGNVFAQNLELAAKAKVDGNVHYESIEMLKGSQVNGSLLFATKTGNGIVKKSGD